MFANPTHSYTIKPFPGTTAPHSHERLTTELSTRKKLFFWAVNAFCLATSLWMVPTSLPLRHSWADLIQVLSALVFVSLVLERALEVFIATWRSPAVADLDHFIQWQKDTLTSMKEQRTQSGINEAALQEAVAKLKALEHERITYKSETQLLALWMGLLGGILISAVGLRTLHLLVTPEALAHFSPLQTQVFHLLDVLLTGGLIAGGSAGIHSVAQVFTTFMDVTAERVKHK